MVCSHYMFSKGVFLRVCGDKQELRWECVQQLFLCIQFMERVQSVHK